MRCVDPATMTPAARVAELAEILATGFQRFRAAEVKAPPAASATTNPQNTQDHLDVLGGVEAPCGSPKESA